MYGAILGDIIGSPYEFDRSPKVKDFPLFSEDSMFTDDSVMTVAVAEALMDSLGKDEKAHKEALVASMQKWGNRIPNAGYGGMFYRWLHSDNPQPYGSYGNGSAMRVSSVGWLYDTIEETREKARWTAEVTHNHPEGIRGAEAVASAIFLARTDHTKDQIKDYIIRNFYYDLSRTCDEIRPGYHHVETCQETVPEAITAFLEGEGFIDAIRTAVSLGGDCDTLTCITGSIAEAFWKIEWRLVYRCVDMITEEMKQVCIRFNQYRQAADERWVRRVAAGELDCGENFSAESAREQVANWDDKGKIFMALKKGYETGDFEDVEQYLTDESVFESQMVLVPLNGKKKIMKYLRGKGKTLIREEAFAMASFPGGLMAERMHVEQECTGSAMDVVIQLDENRLVKRIDLELA